MADLFKKKEKKKNYKKKLELIKKKKIKEKAKKTAKKLGKPIKNKYLNERDLTTPLSNTPNFKMGRPY